MCAEIGLNRYYCLVKKKKERIGRLILLDSDGNNIIYKIRLDALKYLYRECSREDCDGEEEYEEAESRKQV